MIRRVAVLLLVLFAVAVPALAGWEDSFLPQHLAYIEGTQVAPPESLVFPERKRQMSANHNAMRLVLWYRSGDPAAVEEMRAWLRDQLLTGHQGGEILSTVYSGFYEISLVDLAMEALRRRDMETLRLARQWWLDHVALYWHHRIELVDGELRVMVSCSRCNRPAEYGQGGVARIFIGEPTKRDLAIISQGWRNQPTPQLWAIARGIESGALRTVPEKWLEHRRPVLQQTVTVWRWGEPGRRRVVSWAPVLESPRSAIQWAACWREELPANWGDPGGKNPIYLREPKGKRGPMEAPTVPACVIEAIEAGEVGDATAIQFGSPGSSPSSLAPSSATAASAAASSSSDSEMLVKNSSNSASMPDPPPP